MKSRRLVSERGLAASPGPSSPGLRRRSDQSRSTPAGGVLERVITVLDLAVGATAAVIGLAGLLLVTGHPQAALGLALWGVVVVSFIDNLVKPWLLKDRMEINGGLIFFALVGGIATFGPVGLVAGPLILSFFLAVVRLWRKELRPVAA